MKKLARALCIVLSLAGAQAVLAADDPPKGEIGRTVEMQATVTAIDLDTRMVTLRGFPKLERLGASRHVAATVKP